MGIFSPSSVYLTTQNNGVNVNLPTVPCCSQHKFPWTQYSPYNPIVGNQIVCNATDSSCIVFGGGTYMFTTSIYFAAPSIGTNPTSVDYQWYVEGVGGCASGEVDQTGTSGSTAMPSSTGACLLTLPSSPTKIWVYYNWGGSIMPTVVPFNFAWALAVRVG